VFDAAQHEPGGPARFYRRLPAPPALIFEQQQM